MHKGPKRVHRRLAVKIDLHCEFSLRARQIVSIRARGQETSVCANLQAIMGKIDLRDFNCTVNCPTSSWRASHNFSRPVVMQLIAAIKIPEEKDFAMKVVVQFAYR
jgi:hypothetical protein